MPYTNRHRVICEGGKFLAELACGLDQSQELARSANWAKNRVVDLGELSFRPRWEAPNFIEETGFLRDWLGNLDSNQDKQSQSLLCYRYTIPHRSY
jgi:hypothetical protein